jgi:hypothetical protein
VTRFWLVTATVVLLCLASLWYGLAKYARFDVSDADDYELSDRYRLICGAYPDLQFDASRIPAELHPLLPIASRYGHGIRVMLEDCVAKLNRKDAASIASQINLHAAAIEAWISKHPSSFNAIEVTAFRSLLLMRSMLMPIRTDPDKQVS